MGTIDTFFMFEGKAEEAMNFYVSLFRNSEVLTIERYGPEGPGAEGTVVQATFSLNGQQYRCIDSSVKHAFTFTPAISLFVTCDTEEEIDDLFEKLSRGGSVLMPLDVYPFSRKFAWVADSFGVTWQLSLPNS
ncbi:VOC family protein [Paenibacillus sp. L3-i20]|uniref:VOC family protein n=1 Tax=Paenibacillus sp. L3-i20 TaxID=2905833 RepID=UPI00208C5032|nr:VOC family protein [Paenibacillus sp. L3-i20]GKU77054.1 VOC family protein [Paenibacillus sp. L3-i20]